VAGKVTAGLAQSNGSLPPGGWLIVTCGLTACTPGSAPGPMLGDEYWKTLHIYRHLAWWKSILLASEPYYCLVFRQYLLKMIWFKHFSHCCALLKLILQFVWDFHKCICECMLSDKRLSAVVIILYNSFYRLCICFVPGWNNFAVHCFEVGQERFLWKIWPVSDFQSC